MLLQFLPAAGAYRTRALAQLTAKALYVAHTAESASLASVRREVAELAGVGGVHEAEVGAALESLAKQGWVERDGESWHLSQTGIESIRRDLESHDTLVRSLLEARFPRSIPHDQLRPWFLTTCGHYFSRFGIEAAAAIFRTGAPISDHIFLPDLIERTALEFGLDSHRRELVDGFRAFMSNPTVDERRLIWAGCQSMFSARLIAAGIGADPITADRLRDSKVLLDTNVLITAAVEARREHSSLHAVARGFGNLGLRAEVLPSTCAEYRRFLQNEKEQVARVIGGVGLPSLQRVTNTVVQSALSLGCRSLEDFERFFAQ